MLLRDDAMYLSIPLFCGHIRNKKHFIATSNMACNTQLCFATSQTRHICDQTGAVDVVQWHALQLRCLYWGSRTACATQMWVGVSPVPVQMWAGVSLLPVQMWQPSPSADVAAMSSVPVQMWQG